MHLIGDLTIEGFTLMIIFKNIFSFILTFFAYDWLITGGIKHTMIAISIVQVVVCLVSIPMCMSLSLSFMFILDLSLDLPLSCTMVH